MTYKNDKHGWQPSRNCPRSSPAGSSFAANRSLRSVREMLANGILDEAFALPPDFIILGAPTLSQVLRMLDVSVVHRVVTGARCPVITVKPPAAFEEQIENECFMTG